MEATYTTDYHTISDTDLPRFNEELKKKGYIFLMEVFLYLHLLHQLLVLVFKPVQFIVYY